MEVACPGCSTACSGEVEAPYSGGYGGYRAGWGPCWSKQGAWTKWEHVAGRNTTWSDLWKAEPHHFNFMVRSVYDVLPSPANLFTWGLTDSPVCQLCQKRGSLEHILSFCPRALRDGRYRWGHDQVLRATADAICTGISISKGQHPTKSRIAFVRAGEKPQPSKKIQGGCLQQQGTGSFWLTWGGSCNSWTTSRPRHSGQTWC